MSIKSDKVKSGYAELSTEEKREVREFIKEYDESTEYGQRSLLESATRTFSKGVGPKDSRTCPCCGKS